jgi:hypothetical protein
VHRAASAAPSSLATASPRAGTGFKAQREALQLKGQLNAKNREILALKDELEMQASAPSSTPRSSTASSSSQLGELETQLVGARRS